MSTQMKDILTTLELLTKDKIDPEKVLEDGELEETLTLDEDGELLAEDVGDNPVQTFSHFGELQWHIEEEEGGFQVYIMGPEGWIAQGQPHATQEEAEADAKSFWEDYNKNKEYDTARHNAKTGHMA